MWFADKHRATPTMAEPFLFWQNHCFSQWFPSLFELDYDADDEVDVCCVYSNAEQYMMAQKAVLMKDEETRAKIMETTDPKQIKAFLVSFVTKLTKED